MVASAAGHGLPRCARNDETGMFEVSKSLKRTVLGQVSKLTATMAADKLA